MICKCSALNNITTDCCKEFASSFWDRVGSHLGINHRLLTVCHLLTDGHTEWPNQTMEQFLWACFNYEQNNWAQWLPLAEFEYNNSISPWRLTTPFRANYNYHPTMQFKPPNDPSFRSQMQPDLLMAGIK